MSNKLKNTKSPSPRKFLNESRGIIDASRTIVKKNGAAERLKRLQAGFKNEQLTEGASAPKIVEKSKLNVAKGKLAQMIFKKPEPSRPTKLPMDKKIMELGAVNVPINNNNNNLHFADPKKLTTSISNDLSLNLFEIPLPEVNFDSHLYQAKVPQTPANNRLSRLRKSLAVEQQKEQMDDNMDDSEVMEWEDVTEQKLIDEVEKIRSTFSVSASSTTSFFAETQSSELLHLFNANISKDAVPLVIVVDTNVFLRNLPFIAEIQGCTFNSEYC